VEYSIALKEQFRIVCEKYDLEIIQLTALNVECSHLQTAIPGYPTYTKVTYPCMLKKISVLLYDSKLKLHGKPLTW
jgi:hypothetical protein